jgi:soluble lytic murein transglycosylase-like protein
MCAAAALIALPCSADVIEIGAQGPITHRGPVTTSTAGVAAIAAPAAAAASLAAPAPIARKLIAAGDRAALSPHLLDAVAWVESRYRADARSPKGAIGLMQLMPATAAELGVDPQDASENARGGAAYLRRMLDMFEGDIVLALAAYNAGPGAVRRYGGVPPFPETEAYVAAVMERLAAIEEQSQ